MINFLQIFSLVPIAVGTFYFKLLPSYARMMVIFFYLCVITEIVAFIFAKAYGNNMIVYYYFVSAGAVILSLAYLKFLRSNFPLLLLVVPVVAFIEAMCYGSDTFNSLSFTIFNGLLLFICLYAFYKMMLGTVDMSLFYLNGVLMFYSIASTLVFLTGRYLQENDIEMMSVLFGIHAYINAVTNIVYGLCLWTLSRSYISQR